MSQSGDADRPVRYQVIVCRGPECGERKQSRHLFTRLEQLVDELGLAGRVELGWQSCFGRCRSGPNILIRRATAAPTMSFAAVVLLAPGSSLYNGVGAGDLRRLMEEHVGAGRPVREWIGRDGVEEPVPPPALIRRGGGPLIGDGGGGRRG